MPTDILPTGFTSIDLQQGDRTAFSGPVSGVEGGAVIEPLQYPDTCIESSWYRATEGFTTTEEFYHIYASVKPWTLDWIDIQMEVPTDTPVLSLRFYKRSVGDSNSDIVAGDAIGAAITFDTAVAGERGTQVIRCNLSNLKETVRRFEPGEVLVAGFDLDTGTLTITEINITILGRTRQIGI